MTNDASSIQARHIAARKIARKAGELAHDYFSRRGALAVETKGAQDYVSQADRAVETLIRAELAQEFPDDAFLGEETAGSFAGGEERIWIVDPIDGTHNFLRGAHYYCVSIAFVAHGRREDRGACCNDPPRLPQPMAILRGIASRDFFNVNVRTPSSS